MKYWLVKSEPEAFSIDDLERSPGGREHWDGIRNYQARNHMRDGMRKGDPVLFYHSSTKTPAVVGLAKVVREAYPDHTAWDPRSPYFDPMSTPENPRWVMVDLQFVRKFPAPLTLADLRKVPALKDMFLLVKGMRLSVQAVTKVEYNAILSAANKVARAAKTSARPKTATKAKPAPKPKAAAAKAKAKPAAKAKAKPAAKAKPKGKAVAKGRTKPRTAAKAKPAAKARPSAKGKAAGKARPSAKAKPAAKARPSAKGTAGTKGKPAPQGRTTAKAKPVRKGQAAVRGKPKARTAAKAKPASKAKPRPAAKTASGRRGAARPGRRTR